ncbi:MAG: hypothetical protein ACJATK_002793, partial [Paracoccaceae bacterium]
MTINQASSTENSGANRITGKLTLRFGLPLVIVLLGSILGIAKLMAAGGEVPQKVDYPFYPPAPKSQTQSLADTKSEGCVSCHTSSDRHTMHSNPAVVLGCTDCHGGDPSVQAPADHNAFVSISSHFRKTAEADADSKPEHNDGQADYLAEKAAGVSEKIDAQSDNADSYSKDADSHSEGADSSGHGKGHKEYKPDYRAAMDAAHVTPTLPKTWHYPSSANPAHAYTILNAESPEFVRFVNPGDYRIAEEACGACHLPIIKAAKRSLMSTSAMFWGGASYNNGILPYKNYILGEAYTREGLPASIQGPLVENPEILAKKYGVLPSLLPLPAWET